MKVTYNPRLPSGKRYAIVDGDDQREELPATVVEQILRTKGHSLASARAILAVARYEAK